MRDLTIGDDITRIIGRERADQLRAGPLLRHLAAAGQVIATTAAVA